MSLSSCARNSLSDGETNSQTTDINEAKSVFEATATDLQNVDLRLTTVHKTTKSDNKSVITPQWESPLVVTNGKFTIFEIPLSGDVKKYATSQFLKDGIAQKMEVARVTTKLILKRNNETEKYIYFVATMVGRNEDKTVKEICYTNNRSFTGYIFISNLDGQCVGIYDCHSGVRQKAEFYDPSVKSGRNVESIDGAVMQLFSTATLAYTYGEGGSTGGGGGTGGGGTVIDKCGTCGNPKTGGLCLYCNPVIVTPDRCNVCNGTYKNCYCCSICKKYPCQCQPDYGCSHCGSYYCNGECQNVCSNCGRQNCSGNCQSTGGGGTTDPDPDENCNDAKCPDCGKCINASKPNCTKCECKHDHKNCLFCNKCVKSNDDSCITRSTSHTTNCPTCECVCPSCGTKINPKTLTFDCLLEISEIFVSTGPEIMRGFSSAFAKMMTTANGDGVEYGGLLSKFSHVNGDASDVDAIYRNPGATYLIVQWNKKHNSPTQSLTYKCAYRENEAEYVLCKPNSSPKVISYNEFANVHTHPDYLGIKQDNIVNGLYMSYPNLGVTVTDIKSIKKYQCLYILNGGNVYELKNNNIESGTAKIISKF